MNIPVLFLALCFAVIQLSMAEDVEAAGKINTDAYTMIEINYAYDSDVLSDVEFSLYRIADISENGEYEFIEPFNKNRTSYNLSSSADVQQAAESLAVYISDNDISAMMAGMTDETGKLYFPSDESDMRTGLYLLTGNAFEYNGYVYEIEPILVSLPTMDGENNGWQYSVVITPKSCRYAPDGGQMEDGLVPKEETADGSNGEDSKLPQTGSLWWPVPVLLAAGMILIIAGMLINRRGQHEK